MDYKPYTKIQAELEGLARKEQYKLLLETTEWAHFRKKIIERDNDRCVFCNMEVNSILEEEIPKDEYEELCKEHYEQVASHFCITEEDHKRAKERRVLPRTRIIKSVYSLEVHHKLYIYNRLPWEYDQQYLISLCRECHIDVHENNTIYTYSDETLTHRKEMKKCSKCSGTGYLPQHAHVQGGICFECGGQGLIIDGSSDWKKLT